ncbi:hypothetical protein C7450_10991 [Chelatococcus asaccharovorans]|uniref:Uncharacterized protein n=1 Tax=Chelatococcus asaccharovorans TaxID=28210 RepID=A0A2V3U0G9_9HYPH|nr:hypothetical protein C7450_10991 [Chelatococcus asaccharovorans]
MTARRKTGSRPLVSVQNWALSGGTDRMMVQTGRSMAIAEGF